MTDALQALYDYTLENRFSAFLTSGDYRTAGDMVDRNLDALRRSLSEPGKTVLDNLCDALYEQRDLELEAMFQAVWSVAREV